MSRSAKGVGGGGDQHPPTDRTLDRRRFLSRMSALTAAAVGGGLAPDLLGAGEPRRSDSKGGLYPGQELPPGPSIAAATSPDELTVAEAARLIRDRQLSPLELLDAHLARIDALDPVYMAFNTVIPELSRERARGIGNVDYQGPLHGIPVAVKDNFYTAGILTTANSHIFQIFVPSYDATAWARLQDGGAVLVGKTQMGPLATTAATTPDGMKTTVNAWAPGDREVSPGGSSSGSATAVAARLASSSTGTQTGGSITNPANAQGLTGLKPTMGRVSLHGIIPLTYTRDHPGPIARDALDAAIILQAMAGPDRLDPRTLGQPPLPDLVRAATPVERSGRSRLRWPTRIGLLPGYLDGAGGSDQEMEPPEDPPGGAPGDDPSRGSQVSRGAERRRVRREAEIAARRAMVDRFTGLGAEVVEVALPDDWEVLTSRAFNNVRLPERSEPFLEHLRRDVRDFGVSLSPWINGLLLPGAEYLRGQRARMLLLERVLEGIFDQCDVVMQTQPFPFDMIGLPLIGFPIGFEAESAGTALPVGAMLGGQPWAEDRLLSVVAGFQAVTDWHRRRPEDPNPVEGPGTGSSRPSSDRGRIDASDVMDLAE